MSKECACLRKDLSKSFLCPLVQKEFVPPSHTQLSKPRRVSLRERERERDALSLRLRTAPWWWPRVEARRRSSQRGLRPSTSSMLRRKPFWPREFAPRRRQRGVGFSFLLSSDIPRRARAHTQPSSCSPLRAGMCEYVHDAPFGSCRGYLLDGASRQRRAAEALAVLEHRAAAEALRAPLEHLARGRCANWTTTTTTATPPSTTLSSSSSSSSGSSSPWQWGVVK